MANQENGEGEQGDHHEDAANNNDEDVGDLNNDFHNNEEGLRELEVANDHGINGIYNGEAGRAR